MTVIVNEQDIDFCVDAIKLIKENNATFVKKNTSTINDKCIDIYKNCDDEVVIKIKEIDLIKAESPQRNCEEQPYEGSPLEMKHKLERANEWNFIKEGKFPAENTECLCIIRPKKEKDEPFGNKDFRAVLFYRNKKFYLEENTDNDSSLIYADDDYSELVVAWKEIVLPKMDDWYVTMSAYGEHVIRRECSENAMYKGTYEECEKWIERKNLNLFTMFRKQFDS